MSNTTTPDMGDSEFSVSGDDEHRDDLMGHERVEIADNLTLQLFDARGFNCYEIDLERCTDSAQVLDFIFQVQSKNWATPKLMFDLLKALDQACEQYFGNPVQGVFCSLGIDRKVKWPFGGSYVDGC